MAVRRIKPIEQHVEKIVLGIAGAAFMGVLAWQFIGPKTTVAVPVGARAKEPVPIGEAYEIVAVEARKLQGEIAQRDFADLPKAAATGLLAEFTERHDGPVMGGRKLPSGVIGDVSPVVRDTTLARDVTEIPKGEFAFHVPQIPALEGVLAHGFVASIHPEDVSAIPELSAMVTRPEPHNLAAITVEATIPGASIRAALEADPDGKGPIQALPKGWWDAGRLAALNVELVRETRLADGTWGERTVVPAMPGRFSVAAKIKDLRSNDQMSALLNEVVPKEGEILRPEWYRRPDINGISLGEEWTAPSDLASADGAPAERSKAQINRERNTKIARREAIDRELRTLGTGGPPGRRGPGQTPGRNPAPGSDDRRREQLEKQRAALDGEIKKLDEELKQLGVEKVAPKTEQFAIVDEPIVQVWAHDVTVKRGATYRYMIRLHVNNPMFGQSNVTGAQAALKLKPTITTADSAWTDAVDAPPETYFFITNASNVRAGGGGAFATVEMFKFEWGYWRRGSARLDPGDPLLVAAEIPDVAKLRTLTPKKPAPGAPGAPGQPGPGGRSPAIAPPGGGGGAGTPAQPDKDAPKGPMVSRFAIARDAFLLDAVPLTISLSADKNRNAAFLAYIRDEGGMLVAREPQADQASAVYKALVRSARAGEESNKNLPDEITGHTPEEKKPKPPGEEPPPPPPPGGGGGGGGGGG